MYAHLEQRDSTRPPVSLGTLDRMKREREKIVCITCYDASFAVLCDNADTDLVLGPSEDGGYYLIGLRVSRPELFEAMPWSTPQVLPETVRRAHALGLRIAWLPSWFDVDTGSDLERLEASLATAAVPRHTRRFFAGRRPWARR